MAEWPANGETDWNTKMNAFVDIGHESDGTHGTKTGWQDRGDPASGDFAVGDLTTDGAWHDLDLSAICPANTKAVAIRLEIQDDAAPPVAVNFRKNGNTNAANISVFRTQVAGITLSGDIIVSVDSDRVIEYLASDTTWFLLSITVKGWWLA